MNQNNYLSVLFRLLREFTAELCAEPLLAAPVMTSTAVVAGTWVTGTFAAVDSLSAADFVEGLRYTFSTVWLLARRLDDSHEGTT